MLNYSDLTKGTVFILDNDPYEVLDYQFLRMQQRKPLAQTKIKNLISGKITSRNFHQSEMFEEAEIEKEEINFIYANRGEYWFHKDKSPKDRFKLDEELIGEKKKFLKPNMTVTAKKFKEKIIGVALPIKADYKVVEAPPIIRGNTSSGGGKTVILDNGLSVHVPFFIEAGDIVRVNTDSGDYTERVGKEK